MNRIIVLIVTALIVAACGGDGDAGSAGTADASAGPGGPTLVTTTGDLGEHVVDGENVTLYAFLPDDATEPTCYEECANNWPPLTDAVTAGDGVDGSLLGSAERTDGGTQVTYNGWPLYYFAGDAAAGETNGQGVGDNWFVVDASGAPIQ